MGIVLFFWIFGSIAVGSYGSTKQIGFTPAFLVSLLLSPLIGFIVALVSEDKVDPNKTPIAEIKSIEVIKPIETSIKDDSTISSNIASIERLVALKDAGNITVEEFETLKKNIISRS